MRLFSDKVSYNMRVKPPDWFSANWTVLSNAGSIAGTTAVTSALGFVYWWFAAHLYVPAEVGFASAAISAMILLGTISALGFGTLLIGELPRQPGRRVPLIVTAVVIVGAAGVVLGIAFALVAPRISPDLAALSASAASLLLFALGVSLTAITLVLDQAVIGLLRGELQLGRNALFATVKLVAVVIAGIWLFNKLGLAIYASWVLGNLLSLVALAGLAASKGIRFNDFRPQWGIMRKFGRAALGHHAFNLTLQAPSLLLPLLVTAVLSAQMNAYFYAAWMTAYFVFSGLVALTTVLYAVGAAEPAALMQRIRLTLKLSLVVSLMANVALLISAGWILHLFGNAYAEQASWSLRILGLAAFPLIIKNHYVAICRIQGRVAGATLFVAGGGLLELMLATLGARMGGLSGLSLGWLVAICGEALLMANVVRRAAVCSHKRRQPHAGEVSLPSVTKSRG